MWHERNVGKGIIAGLVGGLIGTIVMTEFQSGWSKASSALKNGSKSKSQNKVNRQTFSFSIFFSRSNSNIILYHNFSYFLNSYVPFFT